MTIAWLEAAISAQVLVRQLSKEEDPEVLQRTILELSSKSGKTPEMVSSFIFSNCNLDDVDWGNKNLAGCDFSGSSLIGADMSRAQNVRLAKFDIRTRVSAHPNWWDDHSKDLKLPPQISLRELMFRDFDPERDLIVTCREMDGSLTGRPELGEVDFLDLDVAGIDFSWVSGFHDCDFRNVRNIDKAIFPERGERDPDWPELYRSQFPEGVRYDDLKLVPPKRTASWKIE
jgi:uncharacterized protein YjbI with pentapeptide repeats